MKKTIEKICRMTQAQVKEYVSAELKTKYENVIVDDGFVYAQGTFPVLLVAHMDTVHKEVPSIIAYDSACKTMSSPQGIGGDDRCGIYMVLEVIKKFACSVLFCEDEEIGAFGAEKFTDSKFAKDLDFNYIIEFDRNGSHDAVFYDCDNEKFTDFITKEFYEYAYGSFSDISVLAPFLGCAAVNLSCGYYKAHTKDEYIVLAEMERSIEEACKILARTTADDKFEYIEAEHYYNKYYNYAYGYDYDYYDPYYESRNAKYKRNNSKDVSNYYIIEYVDSHGDTQWYDTMACSRAEAIGNFVIENTSITFDNIIDIIVETNTCVAAKG